MRLERSWWHLCKTPWRRLEHVLRTFLQDVLKTFWRCLENVLARYLEDVLKMFWTRLENVSETSWRCLEDVFARRLEDVLKTFWRRLEDVWPRRIYWSWSRSLVDVLKTSSEIISVRWVYSSWSRRLLKTKTKVVFKTSSSRRMFAGFIVLIRHGFESVTVNHHLLNKKVRKKSRKEFLWENLLKPVTFAKKDLIAGVFLENLQIFCRTFNCRQTI